MKSDWTLPGSVKDAQSITSDWTSTQQCLIEGVRFREVRNVIKPNGVLTELYRKDWQLDELPVEQVFQVRLNPDALSAWHAHEVTTDRLFASTGSLLIVLFDARQDSPTYLQVNEFRCGFARPGLITVPPKVWHGVCNIGPEPTTLINMVDRAYSYENPDHWRVPFDSKAIPYKVSAQLKNLDINAHK